MWCGLADAKICTRLSQRSTSQRLTTTTLGVIKTDTFSFLSKDIVDDNEEDSPGFFYRRIRVCKRSYHPTM
jgi:hypothetical protein